jgi:hypothetical protein
MASHSRKKLPTFTIDQEDDNSDEKIGASHIVSTPTLIDAVNNLADNTVSPLSHKSFVNSILKLDEMAIDITQIQWAEIKRLGTVISSKKKPQFARYNTDDMESTFSCPLVYLRSETNPPLFYKIFKYGEEVSRVVDNTNQKIVIDPENILIAKILAEIEYQKQADYASSKCTGISSFTVPKIFKFGRILDSQSSKRSYYIAMEYISTSSPNITSLSAILNNKRVSAALDCHNIVTRVDAINRCLMDHDIWHNDLLNPDNILIKTENNKTELIIIDFGEAAGMEGTSTHIFGPKIPSCKKMKGYSSIQRAANTISSTARGRSTRRAIKYALGAPDRTAARHEIEEHYFKLGGKIQRTKKARLKRKQKTKRQLKSKRKRTRKF